MNDSNNQNVRIVQVRSSAVGIVAFIFGVISIFIFAVVFVPLSLIFALIALLKKQFGWAIGAIICSAIGFATSPVLWGLVAGLGLMATSS